MTGVQEAIRNTYDEVQIFLGHEKRGSKSERKNRSSTPAVSASRGGGGCSNLDLCCWSWCCFDLGRGCGGGGGCSGEGGKEACLALVILAVVAAVLLSAVFVIFSCASWAAKKSVDSARQVGGLKELSDAKKGASDEDKARLNKAKKIRKLMIKDHTLNALAGWGITTGLVFLAIAATVYALWKYKQAYSVETVHKFGKWGGYALAGGGGLFCANKLYYEASSSYKIENWDHRALAPPKITSKARKNLDTIDPPKASVRAKTLDDDLPPSYDQATATT